MDIPFTSDEEKLVEYAKAGVIKYNQIRHQHGGIDTLYSFLLSENGQYYDGASFEPNLSHASVCAERQAISNLILQESYQAKIKSIVVADPVPSIQDQSTPPCGTCRHLIWTYGYPDTSVILMQYIQGKTDWTFPKLEKYLIKDLYPHPFDPKPDLWDTFQPK